MVVWEFVKDTWPAWAILGFIIALVAVLTMSGLKCARHETRWVQHAPVYVKVGDMMLPIEQPAGYENVCVEYVFED